jgi:hypothetical protein
MLCAQVSLNELTEKAEQAVMLGHLPRPPADGNVLAGPGCGACCDLCARPISKDDLEFEVVLTNNPSHLLHFHFRCEQAWRDAAACCGVWNPPQDSADYEDTRS